MYRTAIERARCLLFDGVYEVCGVGGVGGVGLGMNETTLLGVSILIRFLLFVSFSGFCTGIVVFAASFFSFDPYKLSSSSSSIKSICSMSVLFGGESVFVDFPITLLGGVSDFPISLESTK